MSRLEILVGQLLNARQQLRSAETDKQINYYAGRCQQLESDIDETVYKLYGLTAEEFAIVEASTS